VFGCHGGWDFWIGSGDKISGGRFSVKYVREAGKVWYNNNQETYTLFSGAKDGDKFKIKEYEVFRVIH